MTPTGGFNADLSPNAVHTGIDGFMWDKYQLRENPEYVSASDPFWFNQGSMVGNGYIFEEYSGVGAFQEGADQEEILNTDIITGNTKTIISKRWTKQIPISFEAFKADNKGLRAKIGGDVGAAAKRDQDKTSLINTYGDAFAGSQDTTPDGQPMASNSHVTITGVTVDNLETGVASPDNVWTAVTALANQKDQSGDIGSYRFEGCLVPFLMYKSIKEILNSSLIADSAENNLNIFDTDYGTVRIGASVFLGSAGGNTATNANTSYHIMSSNHHVERRTFYGLTTSLIPPENTTNHCYALRALYNEKAFDGGWAGGIHANGTV